MYRKFSKRARAKTADIRNCRKSLGRLYLCRRFCGNSIRRSSGRGQTGHLVLLVGPLGDSRIRRPANRQLNPVLPSPWNHLMPHPTHPDRLEVQVPLTTGCSSVCWKLTFRQKYFSSKAISLMSRLKPSAPGSSPFSASVLYAVSELPKLTARHMVRAQVVWLRDSHAVLRVLVLEEVRFQKFLAVGLF